MLVFRYIHTITLTILLSGVIGCTPYPATTVTEVEGLVTLGISRVAGAEVAIWHRSRVSGLRTSEAPAIRTTTDGRGRFAVTLNATPDLIEIVVSGGEAREPWREARLVFDSDDQLRTVITTEALLAEPEVVVSPFTTIAVAWAEARSAAGEPGDPSHPGSGLGYAAYAYAYERFSDHLGDVDLASTWPRSVLDGELDSVDEATRHGLLLAAFEALASRMEEASSSSVFDVNAMTLTQALMRDATDPSTHFDGIGADALSPSETAPIEMGVCPQGDACPRRSEGEESLPSTPPRCLCRLDANTLRFDLARSLSGRVLPAQINETNIALPAVSTLVVALSSNTDPDLFGDAEFKPFDEDPPQIAIVSSTIADERQDRIDFDPFAVPIHDSSANPRVEIGGEVFGCPDVYKHTHRMGDPDDNPFQWRLKTADEGSGVRRIEVRVRAQNDESRVYDWKPTGAIRELDEAGQPTDVYRVTVLRDHLDELATRDGAFEVSFRTFDLLENRSEEVTQCWMHHPLAPPLWIGDAERAMGSESLDAVNLHPDNNLAAFIEGVPPGEGKGLMTFEVRNGHDEAVYIDLEAIATGGQYRRTWIITNVNSYRLMTPVNCGEYDCEQEVFPEYPTVLFDDRSGFLDDLPLGFRVWDMSGGVPAEVVPCDGCAPDQYRIPERINESTPRRYLVALTVTGLAALAPDSEGPFIDTVLHPDYAPVTITGRLLLDFERCEEQGGGLSCLNTVGYRRYLALLDAGITLPKIEVYGHLTPALGVTPLSPGRAQPHGHTFALPRKLDQFQWFTEESSDLPNPAPDLDPRLNHDGVRL